MPRSETEVIIAKFNPLKYTVPVVVLISNHSRSPDENKTIQTFSHVCNRTNKATIIQQDTMKDNVQIYKQNIHARYTPEREHRVALKFELLRLNCPILQLFFDGLDQLLSPTIHRRGRNNS